MAMSFSSRTLPTTLRACRSMVWTLAALTILTGVFVLMTATLLGGSFSIPFHNATLSGSGAVTLGLVYIGAGGALVWLGVLLGRLVQWAGAGLVVMLVFLAALMFLRAFELSLSTVVSVALYVAVIALLYAPDTQRALRHAAQS